MNVFSIITFAYVLQSSLCELEKCLLEGSDDSAKPIPFPHPLIQDALANTAALVPDEYKSFKPLVKRNWRKHEESIRVMLNEAAYNLNFAQRVREANASSNEMIKGVLDSVQIYCQHVLSLTALKVLKLKSAFSSMELKKADALQDLGEISTSSYHSASKREEIQQEFLHMLSTQQLGKNVALAGANLKPKTSRKFSVGKLLNPVFIALSPHKTMMQMHSHEVIGPDGAILDQTFTKEKIMQGLRECFNMIENLRKTELGTVSLTWKRCFEQAILQVIEHLYKYKFITRDQLSIFYERRGNILKITGKHITKTAHFSALYFPLGPKPTSTYQILDSAVDYIQHSFIGLDRTSQQTITHAAFSDYLKLKQRENEIKRDWPQLNNALENVIQDNFLNLLLTWRPRPRPYIKLDNIAQQLCHLIEHFMDPDTHFTHATGEHKIEAFQLTIHMLKYITGNLASHQSLKGLFPYKSYGYKQFKTQLEFVVCVEEIVLFSRRHKFLNNQVQAEDFQLFLKDELMLKCLKIQAVITILKLKYFDFLQKIGTNEKMHDWKQQKIIQSQLVAYAEYIS